MEMSGTIKPLKFMDSKVAFWFTDKKKAVKKLPFSLKIK
jgi:hypothetical protein